MSHTKRLVCDCGRPATVKSRITHETICRRCSDREDSMTYHDTGGKLAKTKSTSFIPEHHYANPHLTQDLS